MEIKGTGKRLVPKRDIDYLKELKENHSDPSASWGGTEVVANPTLAGTEGDLTGLQVGENKYKNKLYLHCIHAQTSVLPIEDFYVNIYTKTSTPFTNSTFYSLLSSNNIRLSASGSFQYGENTSYPVIALAAGSQKYQLEYDYRNSLYRVINTSSFTLTDSVTEIE